MRPSYVQRIERAHELSEQYPSASELLLFYSKLANLQQRVFESLSPSSAISGQQDMSSWPLLVDTLAPLFPEFALQMAEICPSPLRECVTYFGLTGLSEQSGLLARFWNGNLGKAEHDEQRAILDRFVALAFLQPYAEWLAQSQPTGGVAEGATCPVCSSEPVCAVLRDQNHGARRSLICSLCMNEWRFARLKCPSCGEERFDALAVFMSEAMPHARIDACDTCKVYIKTVDLTKDGRAIPVVDDLATASLDLWALDRGYSKIALNIAAL